MKYQLSDRYGVLFGDVYDTLYEAQIALYIEIEEMRKYIVSHLGDKYNSFDLSKYVYIKEV